ncbi:hypothetical protein THTE_2850 [Thermogutta terrifontis]|uniref:Uncharacterized protein n=1 Tax=Thermogutta terrifontis TaxID=1331910 RepID=A0A286RHN8_9BACT|nr:hypothetical protein THTE_2850 [Thermogutta terrifontis]
MLLFKKRLTFRPDRPLEPFTIPARAALISGGCELRLAWRIQPSGFLYEAHTETVPIRAENLHY